MRLFLLLTTRTALDSLTRVSPLTALSIRPVMSVSLSLALATLLVCAISLPASVFALVATLAASAHLIALSASVRPSSRRASR